MNIDPSESESPTTLDRRNAVDSGPYDSLVEKLLPRPWRFPQYLGFFIGLLAISFTIFVLPAIIKLFD